MIVFALGVVIGMIVGATTVGILFQNGIEEIK